MSGITAVVPNWNRRDLVERVLSDLKHQTHPVEEMLVVDNGSTDGSEATAVAAGARVLQMGHNAGFSRAVNCGVLAARTPWVAVVNNDVELPEDWLERLLEAAAPEGVWFASGRVLKANRRDIIDGTFDVICRGACAWRAGHGRPDSAEWKEPRPIWFVPLTAALIRTELFARVGLLDQRFESYLEDVDLGLRCAKEGYRGVYAPRAVAYHTGSATLGKWHPETTRRISRNQLWLVAKHFPDGWAWRYGWPVFVAQVLWGMMAARNGAGWACVRGKSEALRHFRKVRAAAGGRGSRRIEAVLEESERDLLRMQRQTGFDFYWRLYFALT